MGIMFFLPCKLFVSKPIWFHFRLTLFARALWWRPFTKNNNISCVSYNTFQWKNTKMKNFLRKCNEDENIDFLQVKWSIVTNKYFTYQPTLYHLFPWHWLKNSMRSTYKPLGLLFSIVQSSISLQKHEGKTKFFLRRSNAHVCSRQIFSHP